MIEIVEKKDPLGRRKLVPEILDGLPPEDPRALRSRADLRRINRIMRQATIANDLVHRHLEVPKNRPLRILELGAGDGRSTLRLAQRLALLRPGSSLTMLDMAPTICETTLSKFAAIGWTIEVVTADVFDWLAATDRSFDLVLANLFLHHFEDAELARLLSAVAQKADMIVATEPLRSAPCLMAARLVALIGANDVTRHDAPASVCAGFRRKELSALWSPRCGAVLTEAVRFPFTHAFAGRSHRALRNEAGHD